MKFWCQEGRIRRDKLCEAFLEVVVCWIKSQGNGIIRKHVTASIHVKACAIARIHWVARVTVVKRRVLTKYRGGASLNSQKGKL